MPFKLLGLSDPLVRGILATGYIAPIAAVLTKSGVSKSGSPAAKVTISNPSDFNFLAFEVIARVEDGLTFFKRLANLASMPIVGK